MMPMQNIFAQRFAQMPGGGMPPAGMPSAGGVQVGPWNLPVRPQPQGTAMLSAPGFRAPMTPPGAAGAQPMPQQPMPQQPMPQQPMMQGTAAAPVQNVLRQRLGMM